MFYRKLIIESVERINQILDELQYSEIEQLISIQKSQNEILTKLDKLQEFNEIDDMNNSIVYKKLQQIYEKI